jgi:hypothetical protein
MKSVIELIQIDLSVEQRKMVLPEDTIILDLVLDKLTSAPFNIYLATDPAYLVVAYPEGDHPTKEYTVLTYMHPEDSETITVPYPPDSLEHISTVNTKGKVIHIGILHNEL